MEYAIVMRTFTQEECVRLYRRTVFITAILAIALASQSKTQHQDQPAKFAARTSSMHRLGTWQGTTPCADCSGIVTTLTLYQKAPHDTTEALYKLHLQYIGRNSSFTDYGSWTVLRGIPGNPDATVYQLNPELNPDKPNNAQYYLRVNDDTLQQLDDDKKPIQSTLNFTLKWVANSKQ